MFSNDQVTKIKYFASVTKISNECFKLCTNFNDLIDKETELKSIKENKLSYIEETCLRNCADDYLKLREFVQAQLFNDYESLQDKNKKIMEDET